MEIRLDSGLISKLDDWRSQQNDLPSKSEAVRRLLNNALSVKSTKAEFEIIRFQILQAGLTAGTSARLNDAYLYAWDSGVYPMFHDDRLAKEFDTHFRVNREKIEALITFLDKEWLNGKLYNFYELEDYFNVRYGSSDWERYTLIYALKYAYLYGAFDEKFWEKMVEPMKHPSEAGSITSKFIREEDIYFQ